MKTINITTACKYPMSLSIDIDDSQQDGRDILSRLQLINPDLKFKFVSIDEDVKHTDN